VTDPLQKDNTEHSEVVEERWIDGRVTLLEELLEEMANEHHCVCLAEEKVEEDVKAESLLFLGWDSQRFDGEKWMMECRDFHLGKTPKKKTSPKKKKTFVEKSMGNGPFAFRFFSFLEDSPQSHLALPLPPL